MSKLDELAALVAAATRKPWRRGVLLDTPQTRRWSLAERDAADEVERHRMFANFSDEDQGRARKAVATFESPADAAAIVALRNHADALIAVARAAKRMIGGMDGPRHISVVAYEDARQGLEELRAALARMEGTT